jgi:hypothetical protein
MLLKILTLFCVFLPIAIGVLFLLDVPSRLVRRRRKRMSVNIEASSHCCGIYQMQGVRHTIPENENIQEIINKTKWSGSTCKIIQFSDTYGGRGDTWRDYLIKQGYQVDKFDIGINPKTGNKLFLYHWYVTPKNLKGVAMKLSVTREYTYEQEQEEPSTQQSKPRRVTGKGTVRNALGRIVRRTRTK